MRTRQPERGGQWFACDCRGEASCPPVLVPVAEAHVRRHVEGPWPEHDDGCDFFKDPTEQGTISASYARPAWAGELRLVWAYRRGAPALPGGIYPASAGRRRPGLARLLLMMLERAGLNQIEPQRILPVAEQFAALRAVAREVPLDGDLRLSRYFLSYPPALPELIDRIAATPSARFQHTGRPHGLMVGVAGAAMAGRLHPLQGEPFAVSSAISVFGESDGHACRADHGARAPYVFAAVVGRREPDSPVEVLRAYLHPCMSGSWLFPVDSDYERATVRRLVSLQRHMRERDDIEITIEKPLFDMAVPAAATENGEAEPREPLIPDFLVRASTGRLVVVETMGFDLPAYRARKARLRPAMSRACGGAPVLEHDFYRPAGMAQPDRDRAFWRDCRHVLLGAEAPRRRTA